MPKKQKVVVAMSGGVDSSVTACMLHEQGYEVVGFFMRTGATHQEEPKHNTRHQGCCSAVDAGDARFVAGKLGIHFYALNFERDFEKIIDYFVDEYANGRTPNPCVVCNDSLKFGKIFDYAQSIDADLIATGHYARIGRRDGATILQKAVDQNKDQSYYLFGLDRPLLDRIMFPLGEMVKGQVRDLAHQYGLAVADKPDSTEICFVPDRNYARVVRERAPQTRKQGDVIDQQGAVIGQHDGIANFTVGQRRGLGIAVGLPIYVTNLDAQTNTVTVGQKQDLLANGLEADRCNWYIDTPQAPMDVTAKIRHQHEGAAARLENLGDRNVRLTFKEPQSAVTPGQAVVFYDDDDCLGGGWIQRAVT